MGIPRDNESAGKIKHFEFSHFTLSLHNKYFPLSHTYTHSHFKGRRGWGTELGGGYGWRGASGSLGPGAGTRSGFFPFYSQLSLVLPVFTLLVFFV